MGKCELKEFKSDAIPLVANTKEYALPDDCHFEDIEKVFHGETREFEYSLSKLDYINKYSYFKNDDKMHISKTNRSWLYRNYMEKKTCNKGIRIPKNYHYRKCLRMFTDTLSFTQYTHCNKKLTLRICF